MNDRMDVLKTHKMFINGKFARSESGRTYNWTTPDNKDSINICHASRKDFRDSVSAAKNALSGWSARTAYNRAQIIYRCAEILEGRSAQFIEELRAQGLNTEDAHEEVRRTIERHRLIPSSPGIMTSSRIRSGDCSLVIVSADAPSLAVITS